MSKLEQKKQAKELFLKGYTVAAIAEEIGCSVKTIYNYKKHDKLNGTDWDTLKQIHNMQPSAIRHSYRELVKDILVQAQQDDKYKRSPAFADAMRKHMKTLQDFYPADLAPGLLLDMIQVANNYLLEKAPGLADKMARHWEGIKNRIEREIINAEL